jgi:acetyl esterase/lipase
MPPGAEPTDPKGRTRLGAWFRIARVAAWCGLLTMTGLLVRAEVLRPELPDGVEAYENIVYRRAGDRRVKLDLYVPRAPAPRAGRPAIIAIHGGGWRGGSRRDYGRSVASLAQHGYVVAAVDYALSRPGTPCWPENLEDVREAVRWLRRHASDYGIDRDRIVAMGASAGGHLAALLGTWPDEATRADARFDSATPGDDGTTSARVSAVVDFYGPTDLLAIQGPPTRRGGPLDLFLGGTPHQVRDRYEAASPIHHVSVDTPPILLVQGEDDQLVRPDQATRMARALSRAGIPHRVILLGGAGHGFGLDVRGRDLRQDILAFLEASWKDKGEPHPQ